MRICMHMHICAVRRYAGACRHIQLLALGPRVRRRASGEARLSRWAWLRDIACPAAARVYHADAYVSLPSPADVSPHINATVLDEMRLDEMKHERCCSGSVDLAVTERRKV